MAEQKVQVRRRTETLYGSRLDELLRALEAVEGKKQKKSAGGFWAGMGGGDSKPPMLPQRPAPPTAKLAPIPEKKVAEVPKKVSSKLFLVGQTTGSWVDTDVCSTWREG